ncbi:unnamed protein product [Vitrella brassicaformis CCMP3155]|uniref:MORN repeat-containing protein 5 n=1 Tax=Vitrella brassicaformis (strain CCMP3155) TaxID=1169540 RepID=A0A0G4G1C2_VITBC|nr:unnamed protein product [Vitrella brassicaformis CCMP3155]|eukprot:CEM21891.1 unnamed protein product [Vitrella brassicaformis CCMP3155]
MVFSLIDSIRQHQLAHRTVCYLVISLWFFRAIDNHNLYFLNTFPEGPRNILTRTTTASSLVYDENQIVVGDSERGGSGDASSSRSRDIDVASQHTQRRDWFAAPFHQCMMADSPKASQQRKSRQASQPSDRPGRPSVRTRPREESRADDAASSAPPSEESQQPQAAPSLPSRLMNLRKDVSSASVGTKKTASGKLYAMRVKLKDGNEYTGEVDKRNRPHGTGKLTYKDGSVYSGEFKDGKRHGYGLIFYNDGTRYTGQFVDDYREGEGREVTPDDTIYVGTFRGGLCEGRGVLTTREGLHYEGDFADGDASGFGRLTYPDGRTYEGEFLAGWSHGKGIMTFKNGVKYEGQIVDDKREGKGLMTWPDGSSYFGYWKDGKQEGKGVWTSADKTKKYGLFKDGKPVRWMRPPPKGGKSRLSPEAGSQRSDSGLLSSGSFQQMPDTATPSPLHQSPPASRQSSVPQQPARKLPKPPGTPFPPQRAGEKKNVMIRAPEDAKKGQRPAGGGGGARR